METQVLSNESAKEVLEGTAGEGVFGNVPHPAEQSVKWK